MGIWEKTLYHDGVALMHYSLAYPSGEEFLFLERMTQGYVTYLEEEYFIRLCASYDADSSRRKRYRQKIVKIAQNYKLYQSDRVASVCFYVSENEHPYTFAFTWEKEKGIVMKPCDFGVKRRCFAKKNCFFYNGSFVYIFSKKGELVKKIEICV